MTIVAGTGVSGANIVSGKDIERSRQEFLKKANMKRRAARRAGGGDGDNEYASSNDLDRDISSECLTTLSGDVSLLEDDAQLTRTGRKRRPSRKAAAWRP